MKKVKFNLGCPKTMIEPALYFHMRLGIRYSYSSGINYFTWITQNNNTTSIYIDDTACFDKNTFYNLKNSIINSAVQCKQDHAFIIPFVFNDHSDYLFVSTKEEDTIAFDYDFNSLCLRTYLTSDDDLLTNKVIYKSIDEHYLVYYENNIVASQDKS